MRSLIGAGTSSLSIVLFSVVVGAAILAATMSLFYAWKRRLVEDQEPLPQCNLQERLSQIAQARARHPKIA